MFVLGMKADFDPLFTLITYLPIPTFQHLPQIFDRFQACGEAAIEAYRTHGAKQANTAEGTSLFVKFLDETKNQELTPDTLFGEAANLIVAGSDTTAVSTTYMVYQLLLPEYQDVKEKLIAEISEYPADASATQVLALPYLKAVVNESLRLYGAAPGSLPRVVPASGVDLGGNFMPAGTIVSTHAWTLHRDPTIFEDPDR